jgi:hypothetical protein
MNAKQVHTAIKWQVNSWQQERVEQDRYLAWYLGEFWRQINEDYEAEDRASEDKGRDDELSVESNYAYAFVDTMIANVCPTNPQVTCEAVHPDKDEVASWRENLVNQTLRRNRSHTLLWDMASHAAIYARGISKTVWDFNDNCPRTFLIDPRNFIWDRSVPFGQTRYAGDAIPLTKGEFRKRIVSDDNPDGVYEGGPNSLAEQVLESAGQYPAYLLREHSAERHAKEERDVFEWVVVWEVYDFEEKKLFHMVEDHEEPLMVTELPFWYFENPYDLLVFNSNLRDSGGLSDVRLIAGLQSRLNEIDSLELWHAHTSIVKLLVQLGALDDSESFTSAMRSPAGPNAMIPVKTSNVEHQLRDLIVPTPTPSFSPSFDKMRERVISQIEFQLAISRYSRGGIGGSDVATELALADTATRTRNGRRIKIVGDVYGTNWAQKYVGLWAQYLQGGFSLDEEGPPVEIPIKKAANQHAELVGAEQLGFGEAHEAEEDWWFNFECIPYSPTENHKMIQLQQLQQYIAILVQDPQLRAPVLRKLLELLGLHDLIETLDEQGVSAQLAAGVPGAPGVPGASGMPGAPPDPAAAQMAGQTTEAVMPPQARIAASQPRATL